jgi:polyisoprenoid-binding protein YceI
MTLAATIVMTATDEGFTMRSLTFALAWVLTATLPMTVRVTAAGSSDGVLTFSSARVSLEGTSNMHGYSASTTAVRLASIHIDGTPTGDVLEQLLAPGALKTLEIAIAAATLSSPREGIDKNMHKALKVEAHPDIRFRLRSLEPDGSPAGAAAKPGTAYRAFGWLTIAGVEKEVVLNLAVERKGAALIVTGGTDLLMTDYGITPPKAMLGMLRTNPKVQIRLELAVAATPLS